jgi:hypothetical protein
MIIYKWKLFFFLYLKCFSFEAAISFNDDSQYMLKLLIFREYDVCLSDDALPIFFHQNYPNNLSSIHI